MPSRSSNEDRPLALGELFQADTDAGTLLRSDGQSVALLPLEFMQSLHLELQNQFGGSAKDILYRVGYEWGLQDMRRLNRHLQTAPGAGGFDLWQREAPFVLDSWWKPLAESGWGICHFDFSRHAHGIVRAELQHSVVAQAVDHAEQPACHFYAGLLAGALSFFDRTERHAVELGCRALGHESCTFMVGRGADIDAAESWRKQGTAAEEIIRRFE